MQGEGAIDDDDREEQAENVSARIARLSERLRHKAGAHAVEKDFSTVREMMNAGDVRTFTEAVAVTQQSNTSLKEYVRDQIKMSSQDQATALASMEARLTALLAAPAAVSSKTGGAQIIGLLLGGSISGASILYTVLSSLGLIHGGH